MNTIYWMVFWIPQIQTVGISNLYKWFNYSFHANFCPKTVCCILYYCLEIILNIYSTTHWKFLTHEGSYCCQYNEHVSIPFYSSCQTAFMTKSFIVAIASFDLLNLSIYVSQLIFICLALYRMVDVSLFLRKFMWIFIKDFSNCYRMIDLFCSGHLSDSEFVKSLCMIIDVFGACMIFLLMDWEFLLS